MIKMIVSFVGRKSNVCAAAGADINMNISNNIDIKLQLLPNHLRETSKFCLKKNRTGNAAENKQD